MEVSQSTPVNMVGMSTSSSHRQLSTMELAATRKASAHHKCPLDAPECAPPTEVRGRWNVSASTYHNDLACCNEHEQMRQMIAQIAAFFAAKSYDWFLDGGTLLGTVRHNSTLVPWDHDGDIAVMVDNNDWSRSSSRLTRGNYAERLLEFNKWQSQYVMKPCHQISRISVGMSRRIANISANLECDTGFKVHEANAKTDLLFVSGIKVDIQPMIRVDDMGSDSPIWGCAAHDPPCYRYLNYYWTDKGFEMGRFVLPTVPCPQPLRGSPSISTRCPADSVAFLSAMYGSSFWGASMGNSKHNFWGIPPSLPSSPQHDSLGFGEQAAIRLELEHNARRRRSLFVQANRYLTSCKGSVVAAASPKVIATAFVAAFRSEELKEWDRERALRLILKAEGVKIDDIVIARSLSDAHALTWWAGEHALSCMARALKIDARSLWLSFPRQGRLIIRDALHF
eukprot:6978647-Prymnesium_polylepis.2